MNTTRSSAGSGVLRRLFFATATVAILLGSLSFAHADVIHLNTGGVVKGQVVKETDYEIHVRTGSGLVTVILREDIERIEVGESPDEVYRKRLDKIAPGDAKGHYELGLWAKKIRLPELARDEFNKVIILDPDHPHARHELGYVRNGKGWSLEGSEVVEGDLDDLDLDELIAIAGQMPADAGEDGIDRAALREAAKAARAEARERRALLRGRLPDEARDILRNVRSVNAKERKAAYESLASLAQTQADVLLTAMLGEDEKEREQAFTSVARDVPAVTEIQSKLAAADVDEDAVRTELEPHVLAYVDARVTKPLDARLESLENTLVRQMQRTQKKLRRLIREHGIEKAQERRMKVLGWWNEAREEALKTIFDKSIYPDENHGRVGQPIVDEKVDKVKAVWEFYETLVDADVAQFLAMNEDQAQRLLDNTAGADAVVDDLQRYLATVERTTEPQQAPKMPIVFEALLRYRAGDIDGAYKLAGKLDKWEARLLERLRDARIYEYNDAFASKELKAGKRPTGEEIEQVKITNDYRRMMGRLPLEIDERLIETARGHSNEMTRLGYFAHESPTAGRRSPTDRARQAKYPAGVAENISLGSVTPMATHIAWYNSSGHHRNILGPRHQCMGAGKDGRHWTQNFGSISRLKR